MKKLSNQVKFLSAGLILVLPQVVMATEYIMCGNDRYIPKVVANLFSTLMLLIRIVVPILLVVMGMVSYLKVVFSGNVDDDFKKAQKKLINDIIAAVLIFFVVSIIGFVVRISAGSGNTIMPCVSCLVNSKSCQTVTLDDELCPGFISHNCVIIDEPDTDDSGNSQTNNTSPSNNSGGSTYTPTVTPGTTENLLEKNCCETSGGTYSNGVCENLSNSNAYNVCLTGGSVDGNSNEVSNSSEELCCINAQGTYNNGVCENMLNSNAYNFCLKSLTSSSNDDLNKSCCLTSNGYYKDGKCQEYQVNINAYNSCVGTSKKKAVMQECCSLANGKFENKQCKSSKFDSDLYNRCIVK